MGIKTISEPTIGRVIKELKEKGEIPKRFKVSLYGKTGKSALDFFEKLQKVSPFLIKRVQIDNGAEFQKNFRDTLERKGIIQFFNYPPRRLK